MEKMMKLDAPINNIEKEKPKRALYLDLDDTLFSKQEFLKGVTNFFSQYYNKSVGEVYMERDQYFKSLERPSQFRLESFNQFLSQKFKSEPVDLKRLENGDNWVYSKALFQETVSALDQLKKYCTLGIFSKGFDDFQMNKINHSGLGQYFEEENILISRDKLDPEFLKQIPDGSVIVDNKKEVVQKLQALNRFEVVWINRDNDEVVDGVTAIRDLTELVALVA